MFINNVVGLNGGNGGGYGGAVNAVGGWLAVNDSLFASNRAAASWGGGGAIELAFGAAWITNTALIANEAAQGGAVAGGPDLVLVNCTIANNRAYSGATVGSALGGALFCVGTALLVHVTIANNSPGGIEATNAVLALRNSILANNQSGANYQGGVLVDDGNNFSSDASCPFTSPGSRSNVDPRLGALGDYTGPTPTMPLLPGSPAIDAGADAWCPAVDQRGFPRALGGSCDAGAFEVPGAFLFKSVAPAGGNDLRVLGLGVPNRSFRLQATVTFTNWQDLGTSAVPAEGVFVLRTPSNPGNPRRFYRTAAP